MAALVRERPFLHRVIEEVGSRTLSPGCCSPDCRARDCNSTFSVIPTSYTTCFSTRFPASLAAIESAEHRTPTPALASLGDRSDHLLGLTTVAERGAAGMRIT